MKKIIFTEEFCSPENLFPFTYTRRVQDIRVGILTIREKWEHQLRLNSADKFEGDFKDAENAFHMHKDIGKDAILLLHANVLPSRKLVKLVKALRPGQCISIPGKESIAYCISQKQVTDEYKISVGKSIEFTEPVEEINLPWDMLQLNAKAITDDFALLTSGRRSQKLSATNKVINPKMVFVEKGATIEHATLNAEQGPIYIGKNSLVMEGSLIRGPFALCEGSVLKMGARIYGATTIGPHCIVGGEVKNSVLFGYSNKAHDGYLGDSVVGEWCNLGAGTSNSNMKNNASDITVWGGTGNRLAGKRCGMMMGDYSKTAINTSINTGTVIGVSANVFGTGLTPKYIPNFSWGAEGINRYNLEKALADIAQWMSLKNMTPGKNQIAFLRHVYEKY